MPERILCIFPVDPGCRPDDPAVSRARREYLHLPGLPRGTFREFNVQDDLGIFAGQVAISCPRCGAPVPVDRWRDLANALVLGLEGHPGYACPACGTDTPLMDLDYDPGIVFGRFLIKVYQPECAPDGAGLAALAAVVGCPLRTAWVLA